MYIYCSKIFRFKSLFVIMLQQQIEKHLSVMEKAENLNISCTVKHVVDFPLVSSTCIWLRKQFIVDRFCHHNS